MVSLCLNSATFFLRNYLDNYGDLPANVYIYCSGKPVGETICNYRWVFKSEIMYGRTLLENNAEDVSKNRRWESVIHAIWKKFYPKIYEIEAWNNKHVGNRNFGRFRYDKFCGFLYRNFGEGK